MQELLENIVNTVEKKKVQGLCKKIIKKFSVKSKTDLEFTGNYTLWDYTDNALCLKARILREQGELAKREILIEKVNEYRHPELYKNLIDWYRVTVNANIASDDEYHPGKIYDIILVNKIPENQKIKWSKFAYI